MRALIVALIVFAPVARAYEVRFSGTVQAGQSFRKSIGSGLKFVIEPAYSDEPDRRWSITIEPEIAAGGRADNYARCITPPAHGAGPMDILAWQYAEGEPGLAERTIDFVLTAAGQKAACAEFELNLELKNNPSYRPPPQGTARVRIRDVKLRPAADPNEARVESVAFDVDIRIPGPKR